MKTRSKSIYQTILQSFLVALILEAAILLAGMYLSHALPRLNRNSEDILKKQVENRKNSLETTLLENEDLGTLSEEIDHALQEQIKYGTTSLEGFGETDESCLALMKQTAPDALRVLRQKKVTGIFAVFNQENMDTWRDGHPMSGVYLRDPDPDEVYSERNTDLQMERSPLALVRAMKLSEGTSWKPHLTYQKARRQEDFVYPVFQAALKGGKTLNAADCGRWTTETYVLEGDEDSKRALAYSIPLILPDGTVYGVLGVEMLTSYLQSFLPYAELQNDGKGTYILASMSGSLEDEEIPIRVSVLSGEDETFRQLDGTAVLRHSSQGEYDLELNGKTYYAAVSPLNLYTPGSVFSGEHWILIGTVEKDNLFLFAHKVLKMILLSVLLMLVVGILFSLLISAHLARPIYRLSAEVEEAQKKHAMIPELPQTGIRELDQFSFAFTRLSRDVLESSTKFLRIMEMASVELGGYEIRPDANSVYVTDNFFELLGIPEVDREVLDVQRFYNIMAIFKKKHSYRAKKNGSLIYRIEHPDGQVRYVRMEITKENHTEIGLLEDVTTVTLEQMRIEHERDYDALTGIYQRQALRRECDHLFRNPERLKHAALLMFDLDNLKQLNDTYGHDWGDQYICHAAKYLEECTPPGTLCGRRSGDEFIAFFYGYDSQEELRTRLGQMKQRMEKCEMILPNGRRWKIHASGGVAWYPEDSTDLDQLKQYADFAMYQAKRQEKGSLCEFDWDAYNREEEVIEERREFYEMIEKEKVTYYFQPIVSAKTGKAEAYEALMRVSMPKISNPAAVMKMAREEGCLHAIEKITMFKAPEAYLKLQQRGLLRGDEKMFINSIASEHLDQEELEEFFGRFSELLDRTVVEITEEESMNMDALRIKQATLGKYVAFALDDYGTGYSNDKSLLDLSPRYIKVDRCIIQDIDRDADKQELVAGILSYAHSRGMYIIAEGMERREELVKTLELGVDYLQGYYLAYPAPEPGEINPEAVEVIRNHRHGYWNGD